MKSTEGKIYLSEQRGILETDSIRSVMTFNGGSYFNEHKQAFKSLIKLNDEQIAPGAEVAVEITEDCCLMLLPITGDLEYIGQDHHVIEVSQSGCFKQRQGDLVILKNPYEHDLINYLQIWFKDISEVISFGSCLKSFDLFNKHNAFSILNASDSVCGPDAKIHIGQFDNRIEVTYNLEPGKSLFAYVISGAFEIEGRLLHPRDGLALWNLSTIELECLAKDAVLILIELLDTK
jgi:hypothetical protein